MAISFGQQYTVEVTYMTRSGRSLPYHAMFVPAMVNAVTSDLREYYALVLRTNFAVLGDSPLGPMTLPQIRSVRERFTQAAERSDGVKDLQQRWSELAQLIAYLPGMQSDDPQALTRLRELALDSHLFREIEALVDVDFKNYDLFRWVMTALGNSKKLEVNDPSLLPKAIEKWTESEHRTSTAPKDDVTFRLLRGIVGGLIPTSVEGLPFEPKHGPGAVAERGVLGKYSKTKYLATLISRVRGAKGRIKKSYTRELYEFLHIMFNGVADDYKHYMMTKPQQLGIGLETVLADYSVREASVAKNDKDVRIIAIEPTPHAYLGQGVRSALEEGIKRGKAGRYIRINDQTYNRGLAQKAVALGLATIDMTDASNLISWQLVENVMPTEWVDVLRPFKAAFVTRRLAKGHVIDGKKLDKAIDVQIPVTKAFPMGSPVCFPVMSVVLLAYSVAAIALFEELLLSKESGVVLDYKGLCDAAGANWRNHVAKSGLGVYGDDIIINSRYTATLILLLESQFMLPNRNKSFSDPQRYREACGGHYCDGVDVTPIRPKLKGFVEKTPEAISGLIGAANACLKAGYMSLRMQYLKELLYTKWPNLPYGELSKKFRSFAKAYATDGTDGIIDEAWQNPFLFKKVDSIDTTPTEEWERTDIILTFSDTPNGHLVSRYDSSDPVVKYGTLLYPTKDEKSKPSYSNIEYCVAVPARAQENAPVDEIGEYLFDEWSRTAKPITPSYAEQAVVTRNVVGRPHLEKYGFINQHYLREYALEQSQATFNTSWSGNYKEMALRSVLIETDKGPEKPASRFRLQWRRSR